MTGDIVNLRQVRKARARAGKEARAEENRVRFGRTKAEKQRDRLEAERASRHVEGHKIGDDE